MVDKPDQQDFWREALPEGQLKTALRAAALEGGTLVRHLLHVGLTEDQLLGHLRKAGYQGPIAPHRLHGDLPIRLPVEMARSHLAIPIEASSTGIVTAMADPSDSRSVGLLQAAMGIPVVAVTARASELQAAIERRYRSPLGTSDPTPASQVQAPASQQTLASPTATPQLPKELVEATPYAGAIGDIFQAPGPLPPPTELDSLIVELRTLTERSAVLRLACKAAASLGQSSVFLARRSGALIGCEGVGTPHDAARALWLPLELPSLLRTALHSFSTYLGPPGRAPVDNVFRAAVGNLGGELLIHPLHVGGRVLGLLCVDAVRHADLALERIEAIGAAMVEALQRIIVRAKSSRSGPHHVV
ncbi:MAG: hypothetical protein MJD61_19310 [Proteobacteria bacterium]|nr:hypothetical protein [Pseudomonadota bacterium]